jgi:hypothetical protein
MNDDNAEKAIANLNGSEFNGRPVTGSAARSLERKDFVNRRDAQRSPSGYGPFLISSI